jgi:hypothetical protein
VKSARVPGQFTGEVNYDLPEPPSPKDVIDASGGRGWRRVLTSWIWTGRQSRLLPAAVSDRQHIPRRHRRTHRHADPAAARACRADSGTAHTVYTDPNVLSCTPALELGIDIDDLSAVLLGSLPETPLRGGGSGR